MKIIKEISTIICILIFLSCQSDIDKHLDRFDFVEVPVLLVGDFEASSGDLYIMVRIDKSNKYFLEWKQSDNEGSINGYVIHNGENFILNKVMSIENVHPYSHIISNWNELGFELLLNTTDKMEFKKVFTE